MRHLMILAFTVVAYYDVNCERSHTTDKGNVETNTYHPHQFYKSVPLHHQGKDLFYYNKDLLTANQGQVPSLSNKETQSTVQYREDSGPVLNYPTSYQTITQRQSVAGTSHIPITTNGNGYLILSPVNQHAGYYQPTNQYSTTQPFESSIRQPNLATGPVQFYNLPAYSQFRLPVHQYPISSYQQLVPHSSQQIPQQVNPARYIQPVETPKQISPISQDFQFKTPPLFQHHVYHPLHTSTKHPQQLIQRPHRLGPPTPPRVYKAFTPIIPKQVIPVAEQPVPHQQQSDDREVNEEDENEDKAEVNEEDQDDEGENEKIEEDSNVKEEDSDDDDDFRPFSGKFRNHDDEEDDRHHHYARYRNHDDDEDDHDSSDTKKYSQNIKPQSKLSSKYKYPKNSDKDYTPHFKYQFNPSFYQHKASPGPDSSQPKFEVKMYKYTKSNNEPQGKGSELRPVTQHNQKMYQSKWIISTKSSSSTN